MTLSAIALLVAFALSFTALSTCAAIHTPEAGERPESLDIFATVLLPLIGGLLLTAAAAGIGGELLTFATAPVASTGLRDAVDADMNDIRDAMNADPLAVVRAVFFAMGSIQVKFSVFIDRLNGAWNDFRTDGAESVDAPVLYGAFTDGMKEVWARRHELHGAVVDAQREDTRAAALNLLRVFHSVKGLGLVKAAFVVSMATGRLACLDTRNVQRLGLDADELNLMNNRVNAVEEYGALLESIDESGPETWARWCAEVGERDEWTDGHAVSAVHADFIVNGTARRN